MYTTKEAAERLGVSVRRVNALIASGEIQAKKFGRAWMIDEASVSKRSEETHRAGRPKMGERHASNLQRYTLMSKRRPVLSFVYNKRTKAVGDVAPLEGIRFAPLGVGQRGKAPDRYDLAAWLASRVIPDFRPNAVRLLRGTRFASTAELMFDGWGLSLTDPYWFLAEGEHASWDDLNYYENGYSQTLADFMLDNPRADYDTASSGASTRFAHTPDATTAGALVKAWVRKSGVDYLLKGGVGGENREPYNEVLATRLLSRLLEPGEYVAYRLTERRGRVYSSCKAMTSLDWELVSAADIATAFAVSEGRDLHRGYLAALGELGVAGAQRSIDKMIVVDHLMANFDRHTHNFGLLRNTENPDEFRMAPLFDNGCGFYSRATLGELRMGRYFWESHPFREYPLQQLALVEDVSWFDPRALDGFEDDIAEVLSGNPQLNDEFIEGVQRHTRRQIEAVTDLAAERGRVFPGF